GPARSYPGLKKCSRTSIIRYLRVCPSISDAANRIRFAGSVLILGLRLAPYALITTADWSGDSELNRRIIAWALRNQKLPIQKTPLEAWHPNICFCSATPLGRRTS